MSPHTPEDEFVRFVELMESPVRIAQLCTRLLFRERSLAPAIENPVTLSVGTLTSLGKVSSWRDLLDLDAALEKECQGFTPPSIWVAWFEHVHRDTVERLKRELDALLPPGALRHKLAARPIRFARQKVDHRGCVFISYANEDVSVAERLAMQLSDAKVLVWMRDWETAGHDGVVESQRVIESDASAFLSLMSEHSERWDGAFVLERERAAARARTQGALFYIPVRIDDGKPIIAANEPAVADERFAVRVQSGRLPRALIDDLRRRQRMLRGESA